jgi:hypothetical protein
MLRILSFGNTRVGSWFGSTNVRKHLTMTYVQLRLCSWLRRVAAYMVDVL